MGLAWSVFGAGKGADRSRIAAQSLQSLRLEQGLTLTNARIATPIEGFFLNRRGSAILPNLPYRQGLQGPHLKVKGPHQGRTKTSFGELVESALLTFEPKAGPFAQGECHETYLSTLENPPSAHPRLFGADEDQGWSRCHQCAPGQGPQASVGLSVRSSAAFQPAMPAAPGRPLRHVVGSGFQRLSLARP